ncbi:hypothetical protein PVL29_019466 [Vitis rotundifolia]|uniref:Rhodanese domain-containing protein n=1 Tax=Vitis rotundifolia TaxID=103349 RepID=A0AA38Z0L3_VITRO|nr:hypothetical protein PVL29_019466 [Vitis rotundifolia]
MDSQSSATEVVTIDVHAVKDLINLGYRYLDVRAVEEFNKGHPGVENILNIPYLFITPEGRVRNPEFLEHVQSACSKEDHFIVGCQSGVRPFAATSVLVGTSFKDVKEVGKVSKALDL